MPPLPPSPQKKVIYKERRQTESKLIDNLLSIGKRFILVRRINQTGPALKSIKYNITSLWITYIVEVVEIEWWIDVDSVFEVKFFW